jgi:hypothetical protein
VHPQHTFQAEYLHTSAVAIAFPTHLKLQRVPHVLLLVLFQLCSLSFMHHSSCLQLLGCRLLLLLQLLLQLLSGRLGLLQLLVALRQRTSQRGS